MSQLNRPGGLTALAVINFIYAAINCLSIIILAISLISINAADETLTQITAQNQHTSNSFKDDIITNTYAALTSSIIIAPLLIISGIGYLKLKKTLGYKIGNLYALLSITSSSILIYYTPMGFTILDMISFIYPLTTLLLINTTFKEDLIK